MTSKQPAANQAIDVGQIDLLIDRAYIDGQWYGSEEHIIVDDPATGEMIGCVPKLDVVAVRKAIDAATRAQNFWAALLPQERQQALLRWHQEIVAHKESLAAIMTLEQGKPLGESRGEIDYGASFIEWFAAEAVRLNGDTMPSHIPGRELISVREPLGVVALVTPWNFPNAMLTRKAGAALAAGCAVVAHPSSETPFSALALAELAERGGIAGRGVQRVDRERSDNSRRILCQSEGARIVVYRLHRSRSSIASPKRGQRAEVLYGTGRARAIHRLR